MLGANQPRTWAGTKPALYVAAVLAAWLAGMSPVMRALEFRVNDLRVRWLARSVPASPEIVLVTLDNASLKRLEPDLGRWPWPRAIFAAVLDYCSDAAVVGLDVLFAEPDRQGAESDEALAEAVRGHGRVVSPVYLERRGDASAQPPLAGAKLILPAGEAAVAWPQYARRLDPFGPLGEASRGLGHVNLEADSDGVARRYMPAARVGDQLVPSLGLACAGLYLDRASEPLSWRGRALCHGSRTAAVAADGSFHLLFTDCRYRAFSLADVVASWQADEGAEAPVRREEFAGKIVLVGSTATGLEADVQVAPVSRSLPGLVIHASAIDAVLRGATYRLTAPSVDALLLALLALLPFLSGLARPMRMALFGAAVFLLYGLAAVTALRVSGWMAPVVLPLLGLLGAGGGLSVLYWYREAARRRYLESLEQAKQQFTDMLVHDLKNRVGAITMSLSMMRTHSAAQDEEVGRMIRTAQVSGSRLLAQIYALLDIRRMEEGRLSLKRQPVDAWDLLRDCAREHEEAGRLVNAPVRLEADASAPLWVEVDSEVVSRILGNLVWNALNYARRGTEVHLLARNNGAGQVEMVVANQGRNIPAEQQAAMFDAFVTGVSAGKQGKGPSFGLGLAFCRLACEAHGAKLRVESPWQDGTEGVRMIMSFPVKKPAVVALAQPQDPSPPS